MLVLLKGMIMALQAFQLIYHFLHLGSIALERLKVVVPQGIESVNGSSDNMGCTSSLVDSGGVMVCTSQSYLIDGCSPAIDTSTSDWASQLVTVRKNQTADYILLTFGFDTAVTLTGIEMNLFLCPDWGISAPTISVYADEERNLVFTDISHRPLQNHTPTQSSCSSLSNVSISLVKDTSYLTWHIVFNLSSSIDWVHVGEVRLLGTDVNPGIYILHIYSL